MGHPEVLCFARVQALGDHQLCHGAPKGAVLCQGANTWGP